MKSQFTKVIGLLTLTLLFLISFVNATTYYTGASGSPTTLSLWWTATDGTGTHPANFTTAGDIFEIQNGHTMTTTGNWTVTGTVLIDNGGKLAVTSTGTTMNFGALTISSGGIVNMNRPLTVTGATNISGTINFASTSTGARLMTFTGDITLNSGAVWNVPATGNGANNTFNFGGNFTNNAASFNDLGTGTHTFSGAAKTISGSTITSIGSIAVTGTPTNTSTLTSRTALTGAGNLTNGNGTTAVLNIGGTATITTLTATAANNLVNYTGGAQTAKITTYNNLTISGTGAKTFSTTPTVNGILSMEATGSIIVTTGVVTYGSAATLQYNKPATYTATSEEWITPFVGTGGIIIKNTGAITTPGVVQVGNNTSVPLNIVSGATLTPGANLITLHGDFINAGTLTSGTGGVTIAGTVATQSIDGFTTTGTVTLTKTSGTATLQGNVNAGPMIINGSGGTLNLGSSLTHTFTGIITLTAGTLNAGSSILNENAISTTAWNGIGTVFSAGTGTVNFGAAGAQTLSASATSFNNLTISNLGLKTFTNTVTVNGILSMEGTATVSAAPTYGAAATLQYNTSTSRTAGVEWITPFVASGGVLIANTGTISMNVAKVFNSTAPLTVNSGASLSMSTYLLTLNGNFINNGGTASGTTGGVTLTGTVNQSIASFTTTGTVLMSKTGGTATLTGDINGGGLTINGSGGTLNLGIGLTHTFAGDVTLTAGSLNGGSSTLNENNISTTAWNGTGSIFTAADGFVNFGASGNQTIAANSAFYNLELTGSGNKVFSNSTTINADLSISGAVADLSGITTHSANSITLGGVSQIAGSWGSTASSATNKNNTYFLSSSTGMVNINCVAPAAPTSGGNQTICSGTTIPALSVTVGGGETAYWYTQASGGTLLAGPTLTYTPGTAGTFYAGARSGIGCASATRTAVTLIVNPLPTLLALTGSSICTSPGGNGSITSTSSQIGVNYQLYNGSDVAQGSVKAGTGSGLTWSGLDAGTGYYVTGTNATTSCASNSSTVNISTNPIPAALVLTGSTICTSPGGDGTITSTTSVSGINYQLYDGSDAAVQATKPGTGAALEWFTLSAGNGYYVIATNATSSCVSVSSNTVNITTTANPIALVLTGSTICVSPGNNGTITSSTSEVDVDYQLYDNADLEVGTPVSGTGAGLSWTGLSAATGYYAIGTRTTGTCVSPSSNAVNITTNPIPTITSSATAAAACFSTSSQNTTLSYSATTNTPTNYTITWNTAAHTAGLVDLASTSFSSSPLSIPIAANVAGGTYTGTLNVSNANGCISAAKTFTVTVNTAPSAPTGSATQFFCSGATVANLSASGTSILWYAAASGGSALSTSLTLVNGTHYYASQTVSGCPSSSRLDVTANVSTTGSWMGTTSTDWFTATNWCGGTIPISSTDITIAAGLTRYPSIGGAGAVCNNITIEAGASLTITGTNTLTVSGSWTNSGTFTANSSTVDFSGAGAASINAGNFNNITFSGAGTKTATGALSIAGNVSITNNFTAGAFTHTVSGSWTNSGTFTATGSTINFNGAAAANIGAGNFNNITCSGAGTKTATGALTVAGDMSITNNFTAGSYTHTVAGNWTKSGTFVATGSTIDFNGSGAGNIGACNFNNISFSGAGTKTATGILNITGNLTISNNFSAGSYVHTLLGNWTNNGTFTAGTSTVSLNSASPQTIGGSASTTFKNLIQNGSGVVDLGIATSLSGTLTLTLGLIDLHTYDLTITSTGSISGGSAGSYIKTSSTGRLKQTVPGVGGSKIYPVGNSAYNPMTVQYNDVSASKNFSLRVADGAITNANSSKTVDRKWYLLSDLGGSANLTLTATYNSGEEGSGFNNSSSPQIGYFDGTSWAYRAISSGSGTTTFTANGSAPDFSSASGFFALGSGDAFIASQFAVTNINPTNPSVGVANTVITVQTQNSNGVPTMVNSATGFNLSATNTAMSTTPSGTISQYAYQTTVSSVTFTASTYNTGTYIYDHDATVTATQTSGESLSAGTSALFDVYDGAIYEPVATEDWDAANGWKKSLDGGATWNPATLPSNNDFANSDLIRIPVGITLTANVTASFYSMLIYGTLDVNSSGSLTLNHSAFSDYNIHVHGTLKNSGGSLINSNIAYPFEIHGGTYWHNMNGGSIPVCTWSTLSSTASTCIVNGITNTALTGGLDQTFENFTWDNSVQTVAQTLSADMTVNGALTLTAGVITTGSYRVIVGLGGTASNAGAGYVNGTLRRYVASTVTTGDFPVGDANYYAPFSIAVNTGTPSGNGYLDVSTTAAQPPVASGLSQTKYINRKWTITNNGVSGITTYNPACTFDNVDEVGSPTTGALKLRKLTSGIWYLTNGSASGNTITATGLSTAGLTATSDFYAGEEDCNATNAIWLGSTSTDWNTASNWCSGLVPTATTDVTIPSSPSRQPSIGSSGGTCNNITIQSGASLAISGAYTLDVKANWVNSGTFTPGTGTVSLTGSSAQTITGVTTFNNLTVNNSTGVIAANDITVNGILTLTSANPDATHGTLDMAGYTLSMLSASATVTGTGDVSGIVKRRHIFTPNVSYQFGSQYTTLDFLNTGTQPNEISCHIVPGISMTGKADAVNRYYSFAQTGTTGTDKVAVSLHYLDTELNGNDETKLVLWDHHNSGTIDEHGKTNNSTSNNWVSLSGLTINYVAPTTLDYKLQGLANYSSAKNTWTGAVNTDWNNLGNWTEGYVPDATDDVLIPDVSSGSNNFPILSINVDIKSLEIATGASVTAGTYDIAINGYSNAWANNGTFVPGSGTVYMTHGVINHVVSVSGITQFNNINIAANTFIRPEIGSYMKISGDVIGDVTSIVDLSTFNNTVEYNGTDQYIVNPSTIGFSNKGYYHLIISGSGTKTLVDNLDIAGDFTNNGTLDAGSGTVSFIGTVPQTISGSTSSVFHDLAINNVTGVSAASDLTVNGILDLQSDNPSLTAGSLVMNSGKILYMGSAATTIGIGDVTGIIKRSHSFALNTEYSFGNANTMISFTNVPGQTLPTDATVKVTLGAAPAWGGGTPANAINRILDVAQTGGTGTKAILRAHYRDDELPGGVDENQLSMWIYRSDIPSIYEKGRSNINTTTNFITVQDVDLALIPANLTDFHMAIAPTGATILTWNGSQSTDWTDPANWTPNNDPTNYEVLIPDDNTTPYSPELPVGASCKTVTIETNGVLNAASGATLSLTGSNNIWNMQAGAVFNAGNSTVSVTNTSATSSISGTTDFYNLTVVTGASLNLAAGSVTGISGALSVNGTGVLDAISNANTIDFNGTGAQTIPALDYYNLIISGARTSNNITLASGGTIGIRGTFTASATFTSGDYISTSNTVNYNGTTGSQNLPQAFSFNNLTINNSDGITLSGDATVNGTLTFTSGKITTGTNRIIIGNSSSCSAGTVTGAGTGKYVYGNLRRYVPDAATTVSYDIGDATNYTPASVTFAGTTSGCGYLDASTVVYQPPVASGLSQTKYINRKWTLTNTGVTGFTSYSATFTFVAGDIIGSANTAALVIRKNNGSAWSATTTGTRTSVSTQCTGVTSFSDFVIGEDECSGTLLWFGGTSTDWNEGSNWCSGSAPTSSDNVVIQSGTPFLPHIGSSGSGSVKDITIDNGATLIMDGSYDLTVAGNWSNNGTFTASTSTVNFNGSTAQTINGATTFSTLKINNASGVSLGAAVTLSTLTIGDVTANSIFNDGGYQVTSAGTLNLTSGTFKIGSGASATSYPSFAANTIASGTTVDFGSSVTQIIPAVNFANITNTGNGHRTLASSGTIGISGSLTTGSGSYIVTGSTVDFNGTHTQSINGITYNNLTISGSGNNDKTAGGDIMVNGILNLSSANYSTTQGALHMRQSAPEYVLYMGANATTIGTGDVSGFVNRSYFDLNTDYTFGNQFTKMNFTVGPLPNSVTLELYLTSANIPWKPDAIRRYYDITHTGGTAATRLRFNVHYLDSELNGATEGNLDLFDYHVSSNTLHDHGFTDYNTTDNWVGFGNVGIVFLGTASLDDHFWTLGSNTSGNDVTWVGGSPSGPTDWDLPGNWEGGTPRSTSHVIIPAGRAYYPVLPDGPLPDGSLSGGRIISSIDIQSGGELDATTGVPTLTVTGSTGAWTNHGGFNAGSSNVVFTNAAATMDDPTNFNNVTIADGASLTLQSGNVMRIAGTLSLSSTGILNAANHPNIIEFNGTDQTIVNPNGSPAGYSNLFLSGSGTKTMPGSALDISGSFDVSGTASVTAGAAIATAGDFTLGSGTTFTAGSYSHSVGGNLQNNGATFTTTGSTFTLNGSSAQTLGGTSPSTFNNLILNNAAGFTVGNYEEITGTLNMTSGKIAMGNYDLTLNTTTAIAGSPGSSNYIVYSGMGRLIKSVPGTMGSAYLFPIGTAANYSPATFKLNSGTVDGTSTITIGLTEGKQPNIGTADNYINRFWTFTPTGTFTSPDYDASFTYIQGDVIGSEGAIKSAKYSSGWTYFTLANQASNLLTFAGATSFSDYTGYSDFSVNPLASVNPVCAGSATTVSANATGGSAPYTYVWTPDQGDVASFDPNPALTTTTSYSVTVTDNDGATVTGSVTVNVNSLPTATISYAGTPYCATGTATVTQTGQTGGSYSSTAGLSINASTGAINLSASTPATYTVTYSFTDGTCPNTTTTEVVINALPTITFTSQPGAGACIGTNVTYTTQTGMSNYAWDVTGTPGVDFDVISGGLSTDNSLTVKYLTTGDKIVTVNYANENGCEADSPASSTTTTVNTATHNAETQTACETYTWHSTAYTTSGDYTYSYTNGDGCASVDTLHLTINYGTHNSDTQTACETYTWHSTAYTTSGDYTYSYTNGDGCASVDTLHLTINYGTHNSDTQTACETYTWHSTAYTTSGDYTYSYTNGDGCASVDTLHLTINYGTHNSDTQTACETYTWHSTAYTTSGDYTYSYTNGDGCASVDTLHLTINYGTHNSDTQTACETYTWHSTAYTTSGDYTYSYTNGDGCASVDTLHLTINYGTHNSDTQTACETYTWHSTAYTTSGDYTYSYTNGDGCASVDTLHLTINYGTHNSDTQTACETYTWHSTAYTTSGDYTYSYTNGDGCASVDTLHLTINYGTHNSDTQTACETYTWHSTAYTTSGDYTYSYTNGDGCASVDTLHLTINYGTHNSDTQTACETYTWHSTAYTTSGDYTYSYTNGDGCASVDTLHLTINYGTHNSDTQTACETYTWHSTAYTTSGDYTYSYTNGDGCASVDTLHLTINYGTHNSDTQTACETYTWHSTAYTTSGDYTYSYTNGDGCASVDTLHLTINYGTHNSDTQTACETYTWHSTAYTTSGDYTYSYTNGDGCASVDTLHLTINYGTHNSDTQTACETYTWHSTAYTTSGDYTYSYTNGDGCASVDTLHLTINYGTHNSDTQTACETYTWHSTAYTTSGDYTYSYTNGDGCASVDTLHLTINYGTHNSETQTACETYTWHSTAYTTSGDYTYSYTNGDGCASVDTLHLTINYGTHNSDTQTACETYTWHSTAYTTSGDYTYSYTNGDGCASVDTLHLTINYGTHNSDTQTACETYTWHSTAYTTSGDYTYSYTNGDGCASVDTLHLTINYGTHNSDTQTACETYTWHSTAYTTSGDYTYSYTNGDGCASVDTLHLTINYGTHNSDTQTACETYTWHSTAYTTSGDYTYSYTNGDGCASVDTLHLTINYGTHNSDTQTACETYTWHSTAYTTSGDYTYSYTNGDGCASVDTLHLTINYGTHNSDTQTACETYTWHSTAYTTSGDYTYSYTNGDGCVSVDTLHLTVNPASVGGSITGSATVCPNTNSTLLTLSGYTGSIVKWQSSPVSDFSSAVTDINNTTDTYTATNLSTTTYYRAIVQSGICSVDLSSVANVTITNIFTWTGTNGTAWADDTNWGCGIVPGSTNDVVIPDGVVNYPTISTTVAIHSLTISSVTSSVIVTGTLKIGGSISNSGTLDVTAGTLEFNGAVAQTLPASGVTGNIAALTINNAAGVSLGSSKTVGTLNLTSGKLDIGTYTLIVTTINGGSADSYVKTSGTGVLKTNIANTTIVSMPVGNSVYNPVSITNNSGADDDFDVSVLDEVYENGYNGTVLTNSRVQRTWHINKANANAGSGVDFVFNWNDPGDIAGIMATPKLFHYDGTQSRWIKQNGTTSYPTANSLSYTGYMAAFSPFAIVDAEFTLPLTWLNFSAQKQGSNVRLNWSTATEQNTKDFIVQHSSDGSAWTSVGTVAAAGNSSNISAYNLTDLSPVKGNNYYRILLRNLDGSSSYSKIVNVVFSDAIIPIRINTNPVTNGMLEIQLSKEGAVILYDNLGQIFMSKQFSSGTHSIDVSNYAKGMYMIRTGTFTLKFLIQ